MRHETSVVEIGYGHKCLSPQKVIAMMLVPVALSYPHEPNCGDKHMLLQEKVWQLVTSSLQ
jgi:hypothetical protein